jgi:hypothetical protein
LTEFVDQPHTDSSITLAQPGATANERRKLHRAAGHDRDDAPSWMSTLLSDHTEILDLHDVEDQS